MKSYEFTTLYIIGIILVVMSFINLNASLTLQEDVNKVEKYKAKADSALILANEATQQTTKCVELLELTSN